MSSSPKGDEPSNTIGGKVDEGIPLADEEDTAKDKKHAETRKVEDQSGPDAREDSKANDD